MQKARLTHFVSRSALNIKGMGEKVINDLYSHNIIHSIADIYKLSQHKEELLKLEGYAEKSINQLLLSITKAKNCRLDKFIFGLGIHGIGSKNSLLLAQLFNNIENFRQFAISNNSTIKISENDSIGETLSVNIKEFFANNDNKELLIQLLEVMNISDVEPRNTNAKFTGTKIMFTGKLTHYSRAEAKEVALKNGFSVLSGISAKLDILVIGEKPGKKLQDANELGIKVISEQDFVQMISE